MVVLARNGQKDEVIYDGIYLSRPGMAYKNTLGVYRQWADGQWIRSLILPNTFLDRYLNKERSTRYLQKLLGRLHASWMREAAFCIDLGYQINLDGIF